MSISNLPTWPGADVCYSRAMRINETLCAASYAACKDSKSRKAWRAPEDVCEAIAAMDRGDEEAIKAWNARHQSIWI